MLASFLQRLSSRTKSRSKPGTPWAKLKLENLCDRILPSVNATFNGGVLKVLADARHGTSEVEIIQSSDQIVVEDTGTLVNSFTATEVQQIAFKYREFQHQHTKFDLTIPVDQGQMTLTGFSVGEVDLSLGGSALTATVAATLADGTALGLTGAVDNQGNYDLTGTADITVDSFALPGSTFELTNAGLTVTATAAVGGNDVGLTGTVDNQGNYVLAATADLTVAGFALPATAVRLDQQGMALAGQLTLPDGTQVNLANTLQARDPFSLTGLATLPIAGLSFTTGFTLTITGLTAVAGVNLTDVGPVTVAGPLVPQGAIHWTGVKSVTLGGRALDCRFTLTDTSLTATGSVRLDSIGVVDLSGTVTAQGQLILGGIGHFAPNAFPIDATFIVSAGGMTISTTVTLPGVGLVSFTGVVENQGRFVVYASAPFTVGGFTVTGNFTLTNTSLMAWAGLTLPVLGPVSLPAGPIGSHGLFNLTAPLGNATLFGFPIVNTTVTLTNTTLGIAGDANVKLDQQTAAVHFAGTAHPDGTLQLTGTAAARLVGWTSASATFTLTNNGLAVAGDVAVKLDAASANVDFAGMAQPDGTFHLTGTAAATFGAWGTGSGMAGFTLTNAGLMIAADVGVKLGQASVAVHFTGTAQPAGSFRLTGTAAVTLAVYHTSGALTFTLTNDGLALAGDVTIQLDPFTAQVHLTGTVNPNSHFQLTGTASSVLAGRQATGAVQFTLTQDNLAIAGIVDVQLGVFAAHINLAGTVSPAGRFQLIGTATDATTGNVQQLVITPNPTGPNNLFILGRDAEVTQLAGTSWKVVDHFVASLAVSADGTLEKNYDAIGQKWLALGGASSVVGQPTAAEQVASDHVGRIGWFQSGAIYWTAPTGAHEVHGAISDRFVALGGLGSPLGYLVTDQATTPDGAGRVNHFQGGDIYWSSATGAHEIHGPILAKYASLSGTSGVLSLPTSDVAGIPAGQASHFVGGDIYWSAATGAHEVHGPVLAKYTGLGGVSGFLGLPTSDVLSLPGGSQGSHFAGGDIYWSNATAAHEVHGAILAKYTGLGGAGGFLSLPASDVLSINGSSQGSHFQGGDIYWSSATAAHEVHGAILTKYAGLGAAAGFLGLPTSDVVVISAAQVSHFQGGDVYWSSALGAHEVHGPILTKYLGLSGVAGFLGLPTSDVASISGGQVSHFAGGDIYWSGPSGAHEVRGPILTKYTGLGGSGGALGFPTNDEQAGAKGGRYEVFQNGAIYWSASTGPHVVVGAIYGKWLSLGGEGGFLGYPTSDEQAAANSGRRQDFQGGAVYWSIHTGARAVAGAIYGKWASLGWEGGSLSYPTSDERAAANGGSYQDFQGGSIYWSASTGAHTVVGAIYGKWASAGGEKSFLGYPWTDEIAAVNGGRYQDFQGGHIYWTASLGAHVVTVEFYGEWASLGAAGGSLGYPTSDERAAANGGQFQDFQGGHIYWTAGLGAHTVTGAIYSSWASIGYERSGLGYATQDALPGMANVVSQRFEHGLIYWAPDINPLVVPYYLPGAPAGLFSPIYLANRARTLSQFFFDGMIAQSLSVTADGITHLVFSDQTKDMGDALVSFAQEARILLNAGVDPSPAENVVRILLRAFDQLSGEAVRTLYGVNLPGLFVRDYIAGAPLQLRQGVPQDKFVIDKSDYANSRPGTDSYLDNVMSLDQVANMMNGWWAVTRYATDPGDRGKAVAQTRLVMSFLERQDIRYMLPRINGVAVGSNRGPDMRHAAGFLSKMADAITGGGYFNDSNNRVNLAQFSNQAIIDGIANFVHDSIIGTLSDFLKGLLDWDPVQDVRNWVTRILGGTGTTYISVPVSTSHEILLSTINLLVNSTTINMVFGGGINLSIAFFPDSVRAFLNQVEFDIPTGIDSHFHVTTRTVRLGDFIGQVRIHIPITPPVPYQLHLGLLLMAFDPDGRIGANYQQLAMQYQNVWCVLLRSAVLGQSVAPAVVNLARTLHDSAPAEGPHQGAPGGWSSKNRWEEAGADKGAPGTQYNGLDFLSLETLMKVDRIL